MDDLRESILVCVSYLCGQLEDMEQLVSTGEAKIDARLLKELVQIGRDLTACVEAIDETCPPQDFVVEFTNSESEPQDTV